MAELVDLLVEGQNLATEVLVLVHVEADVGCSVPLSHDRRRMVVKILGSARSVPIALQRYFHQLVQFQPKVGGKIVGDLSRAITPAAILAAVVRDSIP